MPKLKITFNSPVVLSFTLISIVFFLISQYLIHDLNRFVALTPSFDFKIYNYVTSIFAHSNLEHITGNLTFILLLGPMLEWKYGSKKMVYLILITALVTGLLNKLLFNTGLIGASGIVFLFIILSSFANQKKGTIPLTFILVFVLFVGKEILSIYKEDDVSQFAHIMGGIVGGVAGFRAKEKNSQTNSGY